MYVRPQNYRYPQAMPLPHNYSGNTFRDPQYHPELSTEPEASEKSPLEEENKQDIDDTQQEKNAKTAALLPKGGFKLRLSSLFGDKFGSEEFLILAVILLLADSPDGNDDLLLFLLLLFFIK